MYRLGVATIMLTAPAHLKTCLDQQMAAPFGRELTTIIPSLTTVLPLLIRAQAEYGLQVLNLTYGKARMRVPLGPTRAPWRAPKMFAVNVIMGMADGLQVCKVAIYIPAMMMEKTGQSKATLDSEQGLSTAPPMPRVT